jgi:hypothetical protein
MFVSALRVLGLLIFMSVTATGQVVLPHRYDGPEVIGDGGPYVVPIYINQNDFSPSRYTIYARVGSGAMLPYLFDTGAQQLTSVIGGQSGLATDCFSFASGTSYCYYPLNSTITLGYKSGYNVVMSRPMNYGAVAQIGNQATTGAALADGTYGDFGAGFYGSGTMSSVLSNITLRSGLLPGWIVDVAGQTNVTNGQGTLTIGLTQQMIDNAKNNPASIVMPMSTSGVLIPGPTSVPGPNGLIPGANTAQVSNTIVTISKAGKTVSQILPTVFDTGGGPNAVVYDPNYIDVDGGKLTISYNGKTIVSYDGVTPWGGKVVAMSPTIGWPRANPGGATIYQNFVVMFALAATQNSGGQVILIPKQ